ncbi:hypothetical protein RRF57_011602 [Xylaria bambusicola]|uniref:Uncharacterized protein n=1 Tax=Xylaria bambusicola TaxID=326684 RepID=A0AAN7UN47_9PEZI
MSKGTKRCTEKGQVGPRKVQKLHQTRTAATKKKQKMPRTAVQGAAATKADQKRAPAVVEEPLLTAREMNLILNTPLRPRPAPMAPRWSTYDPYYSTEGRR